MAGLVAETEMPLADLAATVPASPFYTGDIRGLDYDGDRAELLAQVAESARRAGMAVDTSDGVRLERPGAFAQLRASVTEADMFTAALDALDRDSLLAMAAALESVLPPAARHLAEPVRRRVQGA